MDIVVKSFFRPYYLERCLRSIKLKVKGDYTVTVLDDGTPEKYLTAIHSRFPDIRIIKSKEYDLKTEQIHQHLKGHQKYENRLIPVALWKNFIADCSEYFLLLEEDAWITDPISVDDIQKVMQESDLLIVKLGWNSNEKLVSGLKQQLQQGIEEFIIDLPSISLSILKPYFNDTFRVRSILNKLGWSTSKFTLPYYKLYTVSSAFFNKEYWQYIWTDAESRVDEPSQLLRAVEWRVKVGTGRYGKTVEEFIKTSFITSSYNSFKLNQFDMIRLNSILNEAWLSGEFDSMLNFPKDYDVKILQQIVIKRNDPLCTVADWNSWIQLFKEVHDVRVR
ncbi:MAG TPA: hypothetical protein PLJ60_17210 [Chryseolinea sp.]|nr:hypothetical protein [Chryseolinea sp.]HPM32075.1 hypothetical protein [Chryseolinea sp.]